MTVILQSEKQRNWAKNCPQLPVLREFPAHGSDFRSEGKWEDPGGHPDLRRQGWVQEDRGGWNSHESCRAESYTEEKHQSCPEGPSWVLIWVLISLWMWKTTQEPEKEPCGSVGGNGAWHPHIAKMEPVLISQTGKPQDSQGNGHST